MPDVVQDVGIEAQRDLPPVLERLPTAISVRQDPSDRTTPVRLPRPTRATTNSLTSLPGISGLVEERTHRPVAPEARRCSGPARAIPRWRNRLSISIRPQPSGRLSANRPGSRCWCDETSLKRAALSLSVSGDSSSLRSSAAWPYLKSNCRPSSASVPSGKSSPPPEYQTCSWFTPSTLPTRAGAEAFVRAFPSWQASAA